MVLSDICVRYLLVSVGTAKDQILLNPASNVLKKSKDAIISMQIMNTMKNKTLNLSIYSFFVE